MATMSGSHKGAVSLGALLVFAGVVTNAQPTVTQPMTAERSRAVVAQLQRIDANRAAAVDELFASWRPYLYLSIYDLSTLSDTAMRAPAWQLYGASLAGYFVTMVQILRGERSAGFYVGRLSAPQARSSPVPGPLLRAPSAGPLWSTSPWQELVYTPIYPCRMVDTRGYGARTGIIPAGGSRTFDLSAAGYSKGQGAPESCGGIDSYSLPSFNMTAWAVNVTVTGYEATGWLVSTPCGGGGGNQTSVINYSPQLSPAIANGLTLMGCYGSGESITVDAPAAATHVIIDVIGYFSPPVPGNVAVTRLAGNAVSIPAGSGAFAYGAACPAGTKLVAGENEFSASDVAVGESREEVGANRWMMWLVNHDSVGRTATVFSRCMDAPMKVGI